MFERKAISLLLSVSTILSPLTVRAEGGAQRAFIAYDEESAKTASDELSAQLRADGIDVLSSPITESQTEEERSAKEAAALLNESKQLFRDVQFEAALSTLNRVRKKADYPTMRDSYFIQAQVHQATGDAKSMAAAMEAFVLLGGEKPDEGFFSPSVIDAYNKAKSKVTSRPKAGIEITPKLSPDIRAEVYMNGARVGVAPLQLGGYRLGLHFLVVRAAGYKTFTKPIVLKAEGLKLIPEMTLLPAAERVWLAAEGRIAESAKSVLASVQSENSSQGVVYIKNDTVRGFKDGSEVLTTRLAADTKDRIKYFVFGISSPNLAFQIEDSGRQKSWYEKWWFWTIIGSLAAGGAAYFVMSGGSSDDVQLTVTTQ